MFEKATPEERKYLDEYRDLTARESLAKDHALERVKELEAQLASKPVERKAAPPAPEKPPAAAPPPAPVAPPTPPPPAWNAYVNMSASEKAFIKATHGANVEDVMYEAWDRGNAVSGARTGGETSHRIATLGSALRVNGHQEARYVPGPGGLDAGWHVGAPQSRRLPEAKEQKALTELERVQIQCDQMTAGLAAGQVRRSPPAKSSIPFTPMSAPPAPKPGKSMRLRQ